MSALAMLVALNALAAAGGDSRPVSEVWPYEAKRLPDGKVQLSYDLTGLKAGILDTEAAAELDEPSLKVLAEKLPKEAKVILDYSGLPVSLEVATAKERAAPARSFGAVSSEELSATTVMERPLGARLLPALHPQTPKLWVSLDAALWKARHANESILAGVELSADDGTLGLPMGGKAFWQALLKASLERAGNSDGDAKEGALQLATHVAAALKRQGVALSGLPKNEQFVASIDALVDELDDDKFAGATSLRSSFTPELRKIELRQRALARPFPDNRRGKAAALTLLLLLEKDAKLKAGYDALAKVRDTFIGPPAKDELQRWHAAARDMGSAAEAMSDFAEFVSRAQKFNLGMPAPFAASSGPIDSYVDELGGPGQENARDEAVISIQEGRLKPAVEPEAPFLAVMDGALSRAVVAPEKSDKPAVTRSRMYRERVMSTFIATLPAPSTDVEGDGFEEAFGEDQRPYGLKIALKVPPVFGAEPAPQLFAALSKAYERLEKLIAATGKAANVSGVFPGGGKRPANNKAEAQKLKRLFRGLELHVAGQVATATEDKEAAKVAEAFLSGWRSDPDLATDLRFAGNLRGGGQMILYGVGRQEVRVSWDGKPRVSFADKKGPESLVLDVDAAQRYLTPVLVTGQSQYPGTLPDRATFRAISDRANRDPSAVDASLAPGP